MSTTHPAPAQDLAARLAEIINHAVATRADLPRFGRRRVFLCGLLDLAAGELGLDRPALERALVEANGRYLLSLSRADHVIAMDPALVAASHIGDLGSDWHFVVDEGEHFYGAPYTPPSTKRVEYQPPAARSWELTHHHIDSRTGERTLLATAEILDERDEHGLVVTVITYFAGVDRPGEETERRQDLDFEDARRRLDDRGFRPA